MLERDKLFLLRQGFEAPDYPGQGFFCWHCALLDGLLFAFPELAQRLCVERIEWPRPRLVVVSLVGKENQSVPLLVLANGRRHHARQVFMKGVPLFLTKTKFSRPYQRDTVSPLSFQDDYARSPRLNRTAPFLLAVTGMAHGSAATAWPSLLQWT